MNWVAVVIRPFWVKYYVIPQKTAIAGYQNVMNVKKGKSSVPKSRWISKLSTNNGKQFMFQPTVTETKMMKTESHKSFIKNCKS